MEDLSQYKKTFVVDATYDHDWLHFLVKAFDEKDAIHVLKTYFDYTSYTKGIESELKRYPKKYSDIVDFFYDEDDVKWGIQEFIVDDDDE